MTKTIPEIPDNPLIPTSVVAWLKFSREDDFYNFSIYMYMYYLFFSGSRAISYFILCPVCYTIFQLVCRKSWYFLFDSLRGRETIVWSAYFILGVFCMNWNNIWQYFGNFFWHFLSKFK